MSVREPQRYERLVADRPDLQLLVGKLDGRMEGLATAVDALRDEVHSATERIAGLEGRVEAALISEGGSASKAPWWGEPKVLPWIVVLVALLIAGFLAGAGDLIKGWLLSP